MKIGLVSSDALALPGGVQQHVRNLQRELTRSGHQVKIISPRYNNSKNLGKEVILLGGSVAIPGNDSRATLSVSYKPFAITRLLENENFDLLHFHNPGFFLPLQILEAAQKYPLTKILTIHTLPEGIPAVNDYPSVRRIFHRWFDSRIDGVILDSPPIRKYLPAKITKPTVVIPNGVDLKRFTPQGSSIRPCRDNQINLLFVGRIEKRKGLIFLLQAIAHLSNLPDLALTIVGDGPLKKECQEYVSKHQLSKRVFFVGRVSDEELPAYYRGADLFVAPATHGESFGIVLLEAMASGLPLVAFANTGYAQTLKNYPWKGALVKPGDIQALANSIQQLVRNQALREQLASFGIQEAQKYAWPKIAQRIESFYQRCRKITP